MSQLGEAPAGCPRARDGGDGPRRCTIVRCDWHLHKPDASPGGQSHRVRLMVLSDDTCTKDVANRVKREGVVLSYRRIGALLGTSRQAVYQSLRRALAKLRVRVS